MGSDLHELILTEIAPSVGVVIATLLFSSPILGVLQFRKDGTLGSTNPLPFPLIFANCTAWVGYAYVTRNIFVFLANETGILMGFFFTFSAYGLATPKVRNFIAALSISFAVLISLAGALTTFGKINQEQKQQLWGLLANFILLIFYAAPLTTIAEVFKTRSSASLYWPLCVMNVVNGTLWVAYGYAITDYLILAPNLAGFVLGILQLVLCIVFPKDPRDKRSSEDLEQPLINEA